MIPTTKTQNRNLVPYKLLPLSLSIATAVFLTACGSDGNDSSTATTDVSPLLGTPSMVKTWQAQELYQALANVYPVAAASTPVPKCDVVVEKITYATKGAAGEATTATAAVMLPKGDAEVCQGKRPILLHAHGTATDRSYDFSKVADKNNEAGTSSAMIAANFAGQGYIVVAPNYAGYDESPLPYHPYLNAKQQSEGMYAALKAARKALQNEQQGEQQVTDSGKLFISGYSQGGHVALATARHLQYLNEPVTAVAPQSGPYALAAFGDAIFMGNVNIGATVFAPLLARGYQEAYGDIYQSPSEVYQPEYVNASNLIPSEQPFDTLITSGKLPQTALFQAAPTGIAALNDISPANIKFSYGFATNNYLVNSSYRAAYLADAKANPDGFFAKAVLPVAAPDPKNNMRKALKDNDLRAYLPTMPVLLCGGNQDPTVFYDINTTLISKLWGGLADNTKEPMNVTVLDVDSSNAEDRPKYPTISYIGQATQNQAQFDEIAKSVQSQFSESVQQVAGQAGKKAAETALAEGADEVAAQQAAQQAAKYASVVGYHGTLVSPACTSATRQYFAQF